MVSTIQRKITMAYSTWLFAIVMLIFVYVAFFKGLFYTYGDAMPWVTRYIILAVLGNIGALAAVAYFLKPDQDSLKLLVVYEILFIIILALGYWLVSGEYLHAFTILSFEINLPTLLNAVLPFILVGIMLFEFIFSKALRLMEPKMR